jgi:hypothetical protein
MALRSSALQPAVVGTPSTSMTSLTASRTPGPSACILVMNVATETLYIARYARHPGQFGQQAFIAVPNGPFKGRTGWRPSPKGAAHAQRFAPTSRMNR